jgi:hypothetical protein
MAEITRFACRWLPFDKARALALKLATVPRMEEGPDQVVPAIVAFLK